MYSHQFQLPDSLPLEELLNALRDEFSLDEGADELLVRTYFDSFDWRLYVADTLLRRDVVGREQQLIWSGLEDQAVRESVRLGDSMPRFAWDLSPGLMRSGIEPLLQMRALLPQLEVKIRQYHLRVLNSDQKTVLRLRIEVPQARQPGRAEFTALPSRLQLLPIRGYPKAQARMVEYLQQQLQLESISHGLLEPGLTALGRRPADYSSKLKFDFSPAITADQATREIHLQLLQTLERNLPGTRADLDSEFLHDLRVAVRRTRSALTQIKGVFTEQDVERFKDRFAWIGQITGPTRDMDVYLLDYDRYRQSLPEQFRVDLDPLHQFLVAHQRSEQRAMVKRLNSPHFRTLLKQWRSFLEQTPDDSAGGPNAQLSVSRVANKRIARIYRRVLDEGLAIDANSPHEALHDLRKSCKKLRYLLEFFSSLYPAAQVRPLIKALKQLLDNLGSFQDLEVQAFKLREFAHQMLKEGEVPADTLLAMGMLVDGLLKSQQQVREEFSERFSRFSSKSNRAAFDRLFAVYRKGKH